MGEAAFFTTWVSSVITFPFQGQKPTRGKMLIGRDLHRQVHVVRGTPSTVLFPAKAFQVGNGQGK